MNLGRFQFEVDPTQTPAWLRLEHRIHISGWLQVVRRKTEDSAVVADAVGRTVTTTCHGGRVGAALDRGSLSQEVGREMGYTWGRQSGLQERKRGSGLEGENWPKRFRKKTLSYFQNLFINFKLIQFQSKFEFQMILVAT
jgi:hypothetical protein